MLLKKAAWFPRIALLAAMEAAAASIGETPRKRFPMLDKLEFETTWAGVFCMTRNWASIFGRLDRGVFASLGYAGIGVPRGTISGKLLAEHALGSESELTRDVQALSGPKRLPPEPFLGLGVRARLWW